MEPRRYLAGASLLALVALVGCSAATPTPVPTATPTPTRAAALPTPTSAVAAPQATPTATTPPKATTGKRGGTFTVSVNANPTNFAGWEQSGIRHRLPEQQWYNKLVTFDPVGSVESADTLKPDLAESWDVTDGGKTLTFHLRRGVKFHDGSPFTAEDARFSINTIRTREGLIPDPTATLMYSPVQSVEAPDENTLVMKLSRPSASLLPWLAEGRNYILPKHVVQKADKAIRSPENQIGTGPFKFVQYTSAEQWVFDRNQEYFKPGLPYLDKVIVRIIPDPAANFAAFRSGRLDWITLLTLPQEYILRQNYADRVVVKVRPQMEMLTIFINTQVPPWTDVRVRRALSLAIGRRELTEVVAEGRGSIGGILYPKGAFTVSEEELVRRDEFLDKAARQMKAKELLQAAGFAPGAIKAKVGTRGDWRLGVDTTLFAVAAAKEVGIDLEVESLEPGVFSERMNARNFSVGGFTHAYMLDDPDFILFDTWACKGGRNYPSYCDQELESLIQQQAQTADPVERRKLVSRIDGMAWDAATTLALGWSGLADAWWSYVKDKSVPPNQHYNNAQMERVWLDK